MNYFTIWVSNCWLLILDKVPPRGPREARAPGDAWLRQVRGQCMFAESEAPAARTGLPVGSPDLTTSPRFSAGGRGSRGPREARAPGGPVHVKPWREVKEFGISMQYQFLNLDMKYNIRIFVELLRLLLYSLILSINRFLRFHFLE